MADQTEVQSVDPTECMTVESMVPRTAVEMAATKELQLVAWMAVQKVEKMVLNLE